MLLPAASRVESTEGEAGSLSRPLEVRFGRKAVVSAFYALARNRAECQAPCTVSAVVIIQGTPRTRECPSQEPSHHVQRDQCWGGCWRKGSDRGFEDGVHGLRDDARRAGWRRPSCRSIARLPTQGRARSQALLRMSTVRHPNALPPGKRRARRWLVDDHERRWTRPGRPNGRSLNLVKVSRVSVGDLPHWSDGLRYCRNC